MIWAIQITIFTIADLHSASNFYLSGWKMLPKFVKENYPEAQIVSVNPVGLKGVFEDINV